MTWPAGSQRGWCCYPDSGFFLFSPYKLNSLLFHTVNPILLMIFWNSGGWIVNSRQIIADWTHPNGERRCLYCVLIDKPKLFKILKACALNSPRKTYHRKWKWIPSQRNNWTAFSSQPVDITRKKERKVHASLCQFWTCRNTRPWFRKLHCIYEQVLSKNSDVRLLTVQKVGKIHELLRGLAFFCCFILALEEY